MASTNSFSYPYLFDVARNKVAVAEDSASIVSRVRLLLLSEPTELYMNPDFGGGLRRYIWQYNGENQKAMIKDRIIDQLRKYEPCVNAEATQIADGLLFTGSDDRVHSYDANTLKLTVALVTIFGDTLEVKLNGNNG